MLKPIMIKKDDLSPKVILDAERSIFLISGKSIVENAHDFYNPILIWFQTYFKNPNKNTHLILYLEYLNSSSALQISNLIHLFTLNKDNHSLNITWLYDTDDETMKEIGEEYLYSNTVEFEIKELESNDFEEFDF